MTEIIVIIMSIILVDNVVLSQFLGICPFLGVSKKMDSAVGMGVAVTFVMVLATAATWQMCIRDRFGSDLSSSLCLTFWKKPRDLFRIWRGHKGNTLNRRLSLCFIFSAMKRLSVR